MAGPEHWVTRDKRTEEAKTSKTLLIMTVSKMKIKHSQAFEAGRSYLACEAKKRMCIKMSAVVTNNHDLQQ
jgi:hypothetical protein